MLATFFLAAYKIYHRYFFGQSGNSLFWGLNFLTSAASSILNETNCAGFCSSWRLPLFATSMSTHFLFCLAGQDLSKEMKLAKNGNWTTTTQRTIFARVACMSMSGGRPDEVLPPPTITAGRALVTQGPAISWSIWHRVANKGFIFAPVTALPCTAFGFLRMLLLR